MSGVTPTRSAVASTASTSEAAQTHTISVGKLNNKYSPDVVLAAVNDVIEFQFFPANHSVARAEYGSPCVPYELSGPNKVGFFSGFRPVDAVLESPPTWNLTINDTQPIFYYCSAPGSCIDAAMVGVINPNASVSLAQQQKDAHAASYMVVPGEKLPTGEVLTSETATSTPGSQTGPATVILTPTSSPSTAAAASPSNTPTSGHGHHLSSGAIAGIAVGAIAALAVIGFLLFLLGRRHTELQFLRRDVHAQQKQNQRPPAPEMKHSYNNSLAAGPGSPSFPYDSEDPRFHEAQKYAYDVPPYPPSMTSPQMHTAELASPPIGTSISRSGSPNSELDTRRNTMSPPPVSLLESIGPGIGGGGGAEGHGQRY